MYCLAWDVLGRDFCGSCVFSNRESWYPPPRVVNGIRQLSHEPVWKFERTRPHLNRRNGEWAKQSTDWLDVLPKAQKSSELLLRQLSKRGLQIERCRQQPSRFFFAQVCQCLISATAFTGSHGAKARSSGWWAGSECWPNFIKVIFIPYHIVFAWAFDLTGWSVLNSTRKPKITTLGSMFIKADPSSLKCVHINIHIHSWDASQPDGDNVQQQQRVKLGARYLCLIWLLWNKRDYSILRPGLFAKPSTCACKHAAGAPCARAHTHTLRNSAPQYYYAAAQSDIPESSTHCHVSYQCERTLLYDLNDFHEQASFMRMW